MPNTLFDISYRLLAAIEESTIATALKSKICTTLADKCGLHLQLATMTNIAALAYPALAHFIFRNDLLTSAGSTKILALTAPFVTGI